MFKICYDIHTRFVQFIDQKKPAKKYLRTETNPSYYLTTKNLQYQHWP